MRAQVQSWPSAGTLGQPSLVMCLGLFGVALHGLALYYILQLTRSAKAAY